MSYTQEQFDRLPKWAQRELWDQERKVTNLEAHIETLTKERPDSNVKADSHGIHEDYGLEPNATIDFYLGDAPYRKFRDMITVNHLRTKGGKVLRVASTGTLVIRPGGGCNVIEITTEGF